MGIDEDLNTNKREGLNKMDDDTLKDLKGSIGKWYAIAFEGGVDSGIFNCDLCKKFSRINCEGCPVYEDTGLKGCKGTPYITWDNYINNLSDLSTYKRCVFNEKSKQLAINMLNYLRSLVPKDKQ
jgi:hypothetical protein